MGRPLVVAQKTSPPWWYARSSVCWLKVFATAPPLGEANGDAAAPSFAAGFALSLINPKGYAAMAALFSGFALLPQQPAIDAILKIGLLLLVIAAVNIAWLLAGSGLTGLFREPRSNRIVNLIFAMLLLASLAAAIRW